MPKGNLVQLRTIIKEPLKIANWAKVERMYRLEIKDEVLVE